VPREPKAPKFDIVARGHLQRGLRKHPDVARHVASVEAIDRMRMTSLLVLAKKLGVDAGAIVEKVKAEEQERWRYTEANPAFRGTLEFDLTVELLGSRVTRKARAAYTFTPEWPYYDKTKRGPHEGWRVDTQAVFSNRARRRSSWTTQLGRNRHPRDRRALERDR
jgi:hypothetical protein